MYHIRPIHISENMSKEQITTQYMEYKLFSRFFFFVVVFEWENNSFSLFLKNLDLDTSNAEVQVENQKEFEF